MENDKNFLKYLVDETKSGKLKWEKIPLSEYEQQCINYHIAQKSNNASFTAAIFAAGITKSLKSAAGYVYFDDSAYRIVINDVEVYLVEKASYDTPFKSYNYNINIINIDYENPKRNINYFIEPYDNEMTKLIQNLADFLYNAPVNENQNAQNFMQSVLDRSNRDKQKN